MVTVGISSVVEKGDGMEEMTRRGFLGKGIAAIAGSIGLAFALPLAGYAVLPAFTRRAWSWSEVGAISQLGVDDPKQFDVLLSLQSGWMKTASVRSVWAFRRANGEIVTYSPICPHLGCAYQWEAEKRQFHCPCHNSIYALSGEVLSGPAPRPLDQLPEKIENGQLYVIYEEYKVGSPKKEVL